MLLLSITIFLLVTPAGDLSNFDLWETTFKLP
jgi:hypothetical protein